MKKAVWIPFRFWMKFQLKIWQRGRVVCRSKRPCWIAVNATFPSFSMQPAEDLQEDKTGVKEHDYHRSQGDNTSVTSSRRIRGLVSPAVMNAVAITRTVKQILFLFVVFEFGGEWQPVVARNLGDKGRGFPDVRTELRSAWDGQIGPML